MGTRARLAGEGWVVSQMSPQALPGELPWWPKAPWSLDAPS